MKRIKIIRTKIKDNINQMTKLMRPQMTSTLLNFASEDIKYKRIKLVHFHNIKKSLKNIWNYLKSQRNRS